MQLIYSGFTIKSTGMKKLLLICGCLFSIIITAQQINEPFSFPIKPGSDDWSGLKTEKERFDAMQIPDDILSRMSTPALVVTCLNYPAFGYIGAYNNYQTGLVFLSTRFNGLDELAKRNDAGKCLFDIYQITKVNGFEDQYSNLDEKYWPIKFSWVELLLAQNKFIESLDADDKKNLLMLAFEKYKMKQISEEHSTDGLISTAFLMARILNVLNYNEFESEYAHKDDIRNFINTSELSDVNIIDLIFEHANNYLNKQN
jgi:hypothetical protein